MKSSKICIVGLGYVGLPLAYAFNEKYDVLGYDINVNRVNELNNSFDRTLELTQKQITDALVSGIRFTTNIELIKDYNIYIVTVPTPIDKNNEPDLTPIINSTEAIASVMTEGNIVIYESTVYPGVTEEICVPILEKISGLKYNKNFFCGYSPERINPGDREHTVTKILKITSGSTPKIAIKIDDLYKSIIVAGTHLAPSIKVAEAAKVIENTQRDVNIALINELAIIFDVMGIDTKSVIEAAATKWNFIKFSPGLVGGHCIGVDPYYLTHKAQILGYVPNLILGARQINNSMGKFVAERTIKLMIKKGINIKNSKILILGFVFKENCPDIRNTKVIDIITELEEYECQIDISDYWADKKEVQNEYNIHLIDEYNTKNYDAVIVAVGHDKYKTLKFENKKQVVFDIKSILDYADGRL
ncbi:MAG: nucleotide sugar dehydrogenase [Campylobacterales bacterium]|nr:nucleotide sugar dehydrogenase [Campylobacterales bacterium]